MRYKNVKIGILGIGNENLALAKFLLKQKAKITICDKKEKSELEEILKQFNKSKVKFRLGPKYLENLKDFDIVFRTPGLPYLNPKIQKARKEGVGISSQMKLFFDNCPCPIIGVTGTKGKGTTSTLIYEILKESQTTDHKTQVYLGGNIGNPPIEFLEELKPNDIVILELSSFQLQDLRRSPHIAVVLDIKIDHLDYHKDEKEYIEAKSNIVKFQNKTDFAVINADYLTSFEFALKTQGETYWFSRKKSVDQGTWVKNGQDLYLRYQRKDYLVVRTSEIVLRGGHNWENICAAITAGHLAGAKLLAIQKVVKTFPGLEHRLEYIGQINGIKFYNDSFSTTPDTTIAAIKSFSEPTILIAGGSEKKADYSELGKVIAKSNVITAILIGRTGPRIKKEVKKNKTKVRIIDNCKNIKEVVETVFTIAKEGEVVLLSPASASFDWFENYKERGNQFKNLVLGGF